MKILTLVGYFPPEVYSSSYLGEDRNSALVAKGHEVVVYTPTPTRGIDKPIYQEYRHRKLEKLYDGKMTVHRFRLMREGKNPTLRALRYTLSCIKQFNRGVFAKDARSCDAMFISSTPPIQGAMAALIKKIRHIPFVYNLQDIFPDSLVGTGLTKHGSILWKIGRVVENFTYRNADKIIVISEDFKRNIMAKGVPESKIEVIYNWVDEKAVVPIPKAENVLYEELNLSRDQFYAVYAGNFGNAQNIDVILKAAQQLQACSDMTFLLFGTGGLKEHFEQMANELHLTNVKFFPLQPYDKVSYVYSLGDVGIVSCKKGIGKGAMPSKTWSIMSAGTAVVANYDTDTDLQEIITKNRVGLFSEADSVTDLAAAIRHLYDNRELCEEYGRNAREFIENNLTKEIGTQKVVAVIESLKQE